MSRRSSIVQRISIDPTHDLRTDCVCPQCHREYSGAQTSGGHCATCHLSFRSPSGFDRHRRGTYPDRRCLTEDELTDIGMVCSDQTNRLWRFPSPDKPVWGNKEEGTR